MRVKRKYNELRNIDFIYPYLELNPYSVLSILGNTKVLCSVYVEDKIPKFVEEGKGWLTCEYSMLPQSCQNRVERDRYKIKGRVQEIQRLIGRSLRAVIDFNNISDRTLKVDCDVLQADGGTRVCSINGAFISLFLLNESLKEKNIIEKSFLKSRIAAISAGLVDNQLVLDLEYKEDVKAQVDANIVVDEKLNVIEFQLTSEKKNISFKQLVELLDLSKRGLKEILEYQI